ncbi:hypothetical protein ABZS98_27955 [Streptomyces avermitilis]
MLIVLVATVPALMLLPFFPGGIDSATKLLTAHTRYVSTLLTNSRPAP